ncbi:MAG: HEPN domain-containing protein [Nitrospinae bacterium]|nr:HEPN domain-containing protein [Nitrospinota bacterium]
MSRAGDESPQSGYNAHRMKRASHWLERSRNAEAEEEKFLFLWIAYGAAYGGEARDTDEERPAETSRITNFLREIIERDEGQKLEAVLFVKHTEGIRTLLDSRYTFKPFWQWARGEPEGADWRRRFEADNERAAKALENRDTLAVLIRILRRLHELRGQILHGGLTTAERRVRTLLGDATRIMADFVAVVLEIMKAEFDANPASEAWGRAARPHVGDNGHERA